MDVSELEKLVMILIRERREGRRGSVAYYNAWVRLAEEGDYSSNEIESLIQNWKHMLNGQVS
jgi:hypothetical protein